MNRRTALTTLAAAGALMGMGTPSAAATSGLTLRTGTDGAPVRRAAKMGEVYLTSCVIRLDGDPGDPNGWARRHDNTSHKSLNVSGPPTPVSINMIRAGHQVGGALRVPFVEARPVAFAFAGMDEAFPALGVDVGVSGSVQHANLVFWHRAQGRYLDVTKAADRALAGGKSANVWFAVISLDPEA